MILLSAARLVPWAAPSAVASACTDNGTVVARAVHLNEAGVVPPDGGVQGGDAAAFPSCTQGSCACDDGVDNDNDGLVDWQFDLGCTTTHDPSEGNVATGSIENGWTVFEPAADTRIVYVSNAGNDDFDGLSPEPQAGGSGPKATLQAGLSLLRDASADWLLLRRGDSFSEELRIAQSGRSRREPLVVASYGSSLERPIVVGSVSIGVEGERLAHVALLQLAIQPSVAVAISLEVNQSDDVLLEGNRTENHGVLLQSSDGVAVRRNILGNAEGTASPLHVAQGMNVLVEENVVYRANADAIRIEVASGAGAESRGNLVYFAENIAGESVGILQSGGGRVEQNVVVNGKGYGILLRACETAAAECTVVSDALVRDNVLIEGSNLGGGILLDSADVEAGGARIQNNLVLRSPDEPALLTRGTDVLVEGNVLFNAKLGIQGTGDGVVWRGNVVFGELLPLVRAEDIAPEPASFIAENNRFFAPSSPDQWFALPAAASFSEWQTLTGETGSGSEFRFADPSRSLGTYSASLGFNPWSEALLVEALKQTKFSYRDELGAVSVLADLRSGFSVQ